MAQGLVAQGLDVEDPADIAGPSPRVNALGAQPFDGGGDVGR